MLFLRALLSFLLLPFVVGGVVPAMIWSGTAHTVRWPGWLVLAAGAVVLLACVWQFYSEGKGTLAPWDAPKHLVTGGLYRYSRNPMYVGVLTILTGWTLAGGSADLLRYTLFVAVCFNLFILFYEEPTQRERFGTDWEAYRKRVRRWL